MHTRSAMGTRSGWKQGSDGILSVSEKIIVPFGEWCRSTRFESSGRVKDGGGLERVMDEEMVKVVRSEKDMDVLLM